MKLSPCPQKRTKGELVSLALVLALALALALVLVLTLALALALALRAKWLENSHAPFGLYLLHDKLTFKIVSTSPLCFIQLF